MASVNPWVKFNSLLPQKTRMIVTINQFNSDGTVTGTASDGSMVRVLVAGASVSVNDRVWVEDGRIAGDAPALTQYTENV